MLAYNVYMQRKGE